MITEFPLPFLPPNPVIPFAIVFTYHTIYSSSGKVHGVCYCSVMLFTQVTMDLWGVVVLEEFSGVGMEMADMSFHSALVSTSVQAHSDLDDLLGGPI